MYARVTRVQGAAEMAEQIRMWQLPKEAKQLPGFKGAYVLFDSKNNKMMSIALWESEKAMLASAEVAKRLRAEALIEMGATGRSAVETYEVIVQP